MLVTILVFTFYMYAVLKGCAVAHYKPKEPMERNTTALDPNHTHFILVDDGTQNKFGGEIDLRSKFEAHVSTLKTVGGKNSPLLLLYVVCCCYTAIKWH